MCRSKNISELNGSGVVLWRLSRCSHTGSPTASNPPRNHGVKKPIYSLPWRIDKYSRSPSSSGRAVFIRK